jgi:hypothetical protein
LGFVACRPGCVLAVRAAARTAIAAVFDFISTILHPKPAPECPAPWSSRLCGRIPNSLSYSVAGDYVRLLVHTALAVGIEPQSEPQDSEGARARTPDLVRLSRSLIGAGLSRATPFRFGFLAHVDYTSNYLSGRGFSSIPSLRCRLRGKDVMREAGATTRSELGGWSGGVLTRVAAVS